MDNVTKNTLCRQWEKLDQWRIEQEFNALKAGNPLETAFVQISAVYHERLHRLKLGVING